MQRKKVIVVLVFIISVVFFIGYFYFSLEEDNRKNIAVKLMENQDGSFNYSYLEAALNNRYSSTSSFETIVKFVTSLNGSCHENRCSLQVIGTICVFEKAIISLEESNGINHVTVTRHIDAC